MNYQRKNILSTISNEALITATIFFLGVIGAACYQWGKYNSDVQNIELKRTVTKQQKNIKDLHDTILIMKLNQKDTITSLQEPTHTAP